MRMSCNGCRVLRKGCSENCSIRPCLQWIKNPESQANATVFLAKFYGRAGLMNLINAGPENLRPGNYLILLSSGNCYSLLYPFRFVAPELKILCFEFWMITAIFRSLLYEACGRIVNPIYGSVGLLWTGSWQLCQTAVEAVLKGAPIVQIPSDTAVSVSSPTPPLRAYDIRHVSKDENSAASQELHKVKTRSRFKRSSAKPMPNVGSGSGSALDSGLVMGRRCYPNDSNREPSHDSTVSHQSEPNEEGESRESNNNSMFSVETVEASLVSRAENDDREVQLELTLGFEPVSRIRRVAPTKARSEMYGSGEETCKMETELRLDFPDLATPI
ncbi:hypothetical protein HHK36_024647 [Tetracentron sinense]|uniref:LOB domain-containing protein n=1 Tax=Tetracentron sinense TaxID=13715 RepID=A0A834YLA7_TETSI|nr:hypothetical protein HHK36_024647 [Tetracentron sinense]